MYQWCDDIIKNGVWDVLYFPDPRNQEKKWGLFLNQYIFTIGYVEIYIKVINQGSKSDTCFFQNLTWSGVYPRSNLSYDLLQKVLKLALLTSTRPEFYVATMLSVIFILVILWRRLWTFWSVSNSRIIRGRIFQNHVMKSW